jgi:hypothetical protein
MIGAIIMELNSNVVIFGVHEEHQSRMNLTMDDVFGVWTDFPEHKKTSDGMVVARYGDICPVLGDKVPFKSLTVICEKEQSGEVIYWLNYVHGGDSVSQIGELEDGRVFIRSDYQCW